jgi:hypothetical protein
MNLAPRVILVLLLATSLCLIPAENKAMLAPASPPSPARGETRSEDLQAVQRVLESKVLRQRLEGIGLTPEEITGRFNRLSDAQLHQLSLQLDALMPGGNPDLTTTIILILIIIILVLILVAVV